MRNVDSNIHIQRMYKYASTLVRLIESGEVSRELLGTSELVQAATVKYLELIGEEAWQLLKADVSLGEDVPLPQIANMRHRMVHAYEGVDWSIVEEAAFEDVPQLVKSLEGTIRELSLEIDPDQVADDV